MLEIKSYVPILGATHSLFPRHLYFSFDQKIGMQQKVYDFEILQKNLKQMQRSRAILALVSGWAAGVLGLTNFEGFLFYLLPSALFSLVLYLKTLGKVTDFLPSTAFLTTSFLLPNLPSYLAAWVFTYGICLVYA